MSAGKVIGAVDIGGTKIAVGALDEQGRVLARRVMPNTATEGFGTAMQCVHRLLVDVRQEAEAEFCGIGIGCTGPVDPISGVIGDVDFLPGWEGRNPVGHLEEAFDVPVAMENDADVAVLAEAFSGSGRGKKSVICVTVGTGIGAGVVLNGALYRGAGGAHPEIGHHVIDHTGPRCFCGAHGCWEVLARGPAMVERMLAAVPAGDEPRETLTAKRICDLARGGDRDATAEVELEGDYLGVGIANLITLYAPDVIALGGSVMKAADLFMPPIRAAVSRNCGLVDWRRTTIAPVELGEDTCLIGAGMAWRHRFGRLSAAC